jgi:GAF domain-containing protein
VIYPQVRLLPDTTAEVVLLLAVRNETIGALTIQSSKESWFDDQDVSVFQIVASQLAIAIENANLYKRIDAEL